MPLKKNNEDVYFHASSREKKVKRFIKSILKHDVLNLKEDTSCD